MVKLIAHTPYGIFESDPKDEDFNDVCKAFESIADWSYIQVKMKDKVVVLNEKMIKESIFEIVKL